MTPVGKDRTLVILLGASKFPASNSLEPAPAFARSHANLKSYLVDPDLSGLCSSADMLDLFDSSESNSEIDSAIADWLGQQLTNRDTERLPTNLLIYYIGHGGFKEDSQDYFLAIRTTRDANPYFSSIPIASLAKTLRENARHLRRFLILDACFAGAAIPNFMSPIANVVQQALLKQNWHNELSDDYADARSGTALLCSSSKHHPSKYFSDEGTMFTGSLVQLLNEGAQLSTPKFSLQMIQQMAWEKIRKTYKDAAVRPEVHCPDQKQGDISRYPLFPNASYRRELHRREADYSAEVSQSIELNATAATFTHGLSIEDMYALVQTANELAAEIDYSVVLQNILEKAGELTKSKDGAILLYKEDEMCEGQQGCFYFAAAVGEKANDLLETRGEHSNWKVPIHSIAGKIFKSRMASINHDVSDDPVHYKGVDQQTEMMTYSMVCVPLIVAGEGLGVMQVLNTQLGSYSDRDKILLEYFANQASVAIRNAMLFKDVLAHMGFPTRRNNSDKTIDVITKLNRPAQVEYITVAFIDMRGFTQLCNIVGSPRKIQNLLNSYLNLLTERVTKHNGIVNKFLGDGLLAIFSQEHHEGDAVDCALQIVEEFPEFLREWKRREKVGQIMNFVDIGIGIVSDDIIIGTVGSKSVRDFTTIGAPVNLAASLEFKARNGKRILIDENTFMELDERVYEYEGPSVHELSKSGQGVAIPYNIYEIKGRKMTGDDVLN
jgi:class 3 adenylate cyclase